MDKSLLVAKPILYQFETQENNWVPDIPFPLKYEKIDWDLPLNVSVNCLDSFNGDKFFKDYLARIFDNVNCLYDDANTYTFIDEHRATFIDVINLINDLKTPLTQTIDKIDHQIEFYKKKKEDLCKIIDDFIAKNNLDNLNMNDMTLFEIKDLILTTRHFDSIFDKSMFDKKQWEKILLNDPNFTAELFKMEQLCLKKSKINENEIFRLYNPWFNDGCYIEKLDGFTYNQLIKICESNLEVFTKIEDIIAFWEKYKIICNSKVNFLKDMKSELIISFFKFVDVWKIVIVDIKTMMQKMKW